MLNFLRGKLTALLIGGLALGLLAGCATNLQPASLQMIDEAEVQWQQAPILNYHIIVEVDRLDERRQNDLTVSQGQVIHAVVAYWDTNSNTWNRSTDLNQQQAFPYTVPGLFDTVRGELKNGSRTDIQVALGGDPPFPQQIDLGEVQDAGQAVSGTAATVTVKKFEPLK
jgi:hypothetical protein